MTEPDASAPESLEEALGVLPTRPELPLPRWLAPLAVLCAVALVPWIGYLAVTLPRRADADNYDLAWIGFDTAMWTVLLALGVAATRRLTATGPIAAVAATLLCVDAWFDVVTTGNRDEFVVAVLSAVLVEVPLAAICAWVAINSERIRLRAYRRLRVRWQRAVTLAREVEGSGGHTTTVTTTETTTTTVDAEPQA